MGIDISQLSPAAQKQALAKLMELERRKAAVAMPKAEPKEEPKRKYHNQPTERIAGDGKTIKFDSKREAARYDELMLMLRAGKIRDLRLQAEFTLQEAYTTPDGERVRAIRYKADFVYEKRVTHRYQNDGGCNYEEVAEWERIVEDVKGGKATQTKVYNMKKKMMQEKFGIKIQEV